MTSRMKSNMNTKTPKTNQESREDGAQKPMQTTTNDDREHYTNKNRESYTKETPEISDVAGDSTQTMHHDKTVDEASTHIDENTNENTTTKPVKA